MTFKTTLFFAFFAIIFAPLSSSYAQNMPVPESPAIDQDQIDPAATYEVTSAKDLTEFYKNRALSNGLSRDADGRVLSSEQTEDVQGAHLHQFEQDESRLGRTIISVTKK